MLARLSIRQKLLITIALPLIAIVALTAFAYPTFQTVKVNGPQYQKIRDAKDIEADILPPPAFAVEGYLDARLLIDSKSEKDVERIAKELQRLEGEFADRHNVWQNTLGAKDEIRSSMRDAREFGQQLFTLANKDLVASMRTAMTAPNESDRDSALTDAKGLFEGELTSLYTAHKKAIDVSVELSNARQVALERETNTLLRDRFALLAFGAFAIFALISLIGAAVTRSINRPIRALTESANRTATVELPEVVERVQAGDTDIVVTASKSPFSTSTDELGNLARAFDSMHNTAVSLAADQASIRRNVSSNLINIGRRNQGLLKRTLNLISQMEQDERDASKLEQMFRLDHLTTRMRRNAESLLILAGGDPPRVWAQSTEIGEVVRAALSQVEAYDRVDFGRLDSTKLKGHAINDVAHLVAELVENATYFSPPTTRVTIHGKQRLDGYLIVIADDGVGMSPEELEQANFRIANPQAFDAEPSKVLGHVVVGRLAKRYEARVRLTENATTGVAAQVLLPLALLEGTELIEQIPEAFAQPDDRPTTSSHFVAPPAPVMEMPARTIAPQLPSRAPTPEMAPPRATPVSNGNEVSNEELQPRVVGGSPRLVQRVRGAQLPDTGPLHSDTPTSDAPRRSADELRGSLGALQRGSALGRSAANSADKLSASAHTTINHAERVTEQGAPTSDTSVPEGEQ